MVDAQDKGNDGMIGGVEHNTTRANKTHQKTTGEFDTSGQGKPAEDD